MVFFMMTFFGVVGVIGVVLFYCQFHVLDALAPPSVDGVEMTVATLDDGGVGILQDGTVLEGDPVFPMYAVVAAQDG